MKITPLSAGFGATIEGIDLRQASAEEQHTVRSALLQHGLLVIRGQSLAPQDQVAVSGMFGELETFPGAQGGLPGLPQIFRVATRPEDGRVGVGRYWHSDGSYLKIPTAITFWHSVVRAEEGGDTYFTDLQRAYAELPKQLKMEIVDLCTVHRNGVVHPLVMPHPKTRNPLLYFNVGLTAGVLDYEPERSAALMVALNKHLSRPGAAYRHHWQGGDVVVAAITAACSHPIGA
jgi:taurine dioxygenase